MKKEIRILILEDNLHDAELMKREIGKEDIHFRAKIVDTKKDFIRELKERMPDIILADYTLPSFNAMDALRVSKKLAPMAPFIIVTGSISEEVAVECMKAGAVDYVLKEHLARLGPAVRGAFENKIVREQKRRAEIAFRESAELFQNISDVTFDGIVIYDRGKVLEATPRFAETFGYELPEIVGMDSLKLIASGSRDQVRKKIASKYTKSYEVVGLKKDGTKFPIQMHAMNMKYRKRNVQVGAVHDISDRKKAEDEVKSLAKFPSEDPNPVLRVAKNGEVLFANDACSPLFKSWKCGLCEVVPKYWRKVVKDALDSGEAKVEEAVVGEEIFSIQIAPIVEAEYANLYAHNITGRKKLEGLKDEFVNTVSHELRAPLTIIRESIYLTAKKMRKSVGKENQKYLDISTRNVDRLNRLVDDILDYQKLLAGMTTFEIKKQDINVLVKDIKEELYPLAEDKGLKIKVRLARNLPIAQFDRDRIAQVLVNLVNNAIKFTEKGGVTIFTKKEDGKICISVSDTGIGIKEKEMDKLFKSFTQITTGRKRKPSGTGLGLVISKKIIEKHKGQIGAESSFGRGSTFWFMLPPS